MKDQSNKPKHKSKTYLFHPASTPSKSAPGIRLKEYRYL